MKVVYLAHQLGQGPARETNRANAAKWLAWIAAQGHAPVATWITLAGEWEETPENRAKGLAIDVALIERCDELWLCGDRVSQGMGYEAEVAKRCGKRVVDWTLLGPLPPALWDYP